MLFAVSVFAILLVVVLIVSFIYGYVYRKKNRKKSEQEEDGGKNVVVVAANAATVHIKQGTIEEARSKLYVTKILKGFFDTLQKKEVYA